LLAAISYRHRWFDALLHGDERPDALELVADHFFGREERAIELARRYPVVIHDTACSIATGGPSERRLLRLRALVEATGALAFTDHLAMTRSPAGDVDLGHLCPVRFDARTLARVVDGVFRLQDAIQVPVSLENIATPFTLAGGMPEAEFWHALVDATGCGLLLDVTNALLDARNDDADPFERLCALPLHAVRQVHLAGGRSDGHHWIDSHSAPVEDDSYRLLAALRGRMPLELVVVERDSHLPAVGASIAEARRAVAAWEVA
jgi:uncharacterized protein (UPF0276 family)